MNNRFVMLSLKRLMEIAVILPDSRRLTYGNIKHKLLDVLAIVAMAIVCGYSTWEDMYLYAQSKKEILTSLLNLENGIPSVSTMQRVIGAIKAEVLESIYREWVLPYIGGCSGKQVNIDGKEVRGVANQGEAVLNNVSVWVTEDGISLGQIAVESKSNEIKAIPILINDLDIEGSIVSIDAIGCQKAIAECIKENGAEYVIALKGNQKGFYESAKEYYDWAIKDKAEQRILSTATTRNYEHGRTTKWNAVVTNDVGSFEESKEWKGIKSIIMVTRTITNGESPREERRYYISSIKCGAEEFLQRIRRHWSIENSLHWELDTQFGEDMCRIHKGNAPRNLSLLRKIAMALMKSVKKAGLSYHSIQVKASLNDDYMISIMYKE